jgi:hypothetical protein
MTLIVRPGFQFDTDASTYIEAVEVADAQALETATRYAINDFVIGCKQDGIWSAIKASCILSGARTTNGALVPLVGTAPTPFNFDLVGNTDYNRKTGLVGNGSTKYLDSNRTGNDDPSDNFHMSFYASSGTALIGTANSFSNILWRSDNAVRIKSAVSLGTSPAASGPYFGGGNKSGSAITARVAGINYTQTRTDSGTTENITLYRFVQTNLIPSYSSARLSFYSIGESLDLALLDARVSALITAFGVAIP